ncbi:UNVERIFIED_CONTAM: hypothetical protein PYX00_001104 [Menopon gallinae]|uniref:Uncharacterized protein n=1 Tax=Menopon gallinae TaxID=328185 RepID=A0AAW2IDK2_9NEOP
MFRSSGFKRYILISSTTPILHPYARASSVSLLVTLTLHRSRQERTFSALANSSVSTARTTSGTTA